MPMTRKLRLLIAPGFSLLAVSALACGSDDVAGSGGETTAETSGTSTEGGTESHQVCEPLSEQACACPEVVVGLAAEIIGAALSLENDDHLFNASQIIPADLHLQMTQGVWWSVRRTGTFMLKNWDWELRMEAWGCTDDGIG